MIGRDSVWESAQFPEVSAVLVLRAALAVACEREAGKRASGARRQRVTPSRGDLHTTRHPISCSSSLAFHHQKYFSSVTQLLRPAPTFGSALARTALARPWPRCARKVQVFEPERAIGRGARGSAPPMARRARLRALAIGPSATRQWPRRPEFVARRGSFAGELRTPVETIFARRSPARSRSDCIARSADHFADFHS